MSWPPAIHTQASAARARQRAKCPKWKCVRAGRPVRSGEDRTVFMITVLAPSDHCSSRLREGLFSQLQQDPYERQSRVAPSAKKMKKKKKIQRDGQAPYPFHTA